jgi:hypothetical protein
MENQITAIDWLVYRLDIILPLDIEWDKLEKLFKQAKQMEMEQITDAWEDGKDSFSTRNAEEYYNQTFKK